MKYSKIFPLLSIILITLSFNSCIEEVEITSDNFEDILVIEAVLTIEVKKHQITLRRSYPLNSIGSKIIPEKNAVVKIIDDNNNEYNFLEEENGVYKSNLEFGASSNIGYKLYIKSQNNEEYTTEFNKLPNSNSENDIYFEEYKNGDDGGVTFYTNSVDSSGDSKYYRYEFEGTYKIVAPYWSPYDLVAEENEEDGVYLQLKTREERVCYKTELINNNIILKNSSNLSQDIIEPFEITSISKKDFRIAHRYSMLIKQYVLSREAYNYYETLKKTSGGNDNVFSENQPGFIIGNITNVNKPNDKVVGFFDVSRVFTKRTFFNFYDFYLGQDLPSVTPGGCPYLAPLDNGPTESTGLLSNSLWYLVKNGLVKFIIENDSGPGRYYVTTPVCGDCNELGSNIRPSFWQD